MSGSGTQNDPWDLGTALGQLAPDDTLHLFDTGALKSSFDGVFTFSSGGSVDRPIRVRPVGDSPKINGGVIASGGYVYFYNLEIYWDGWTTRESAEEGSSPTDIDKTKALVVTGAKIKFINCIIHDLSEVGWWDASIDSDFYGCVIYNVGWKGTDRGHGHAIYTQNLSGRKKIRHCILFNCFGYNLHIYGSDGRMSYYDIEENVFFNAGILGDGTSAPWYGVMIGAGSVASGNRLIRNMTYNNVKGFYSFGQGGNHYEAIDNYFPDGWDITSASFDINSGNYTGPAVGNQSFIHQNDYITSRANLVIYNQAQADTIEVDVSAIYPNGTQVQARNVQDYFNDIQTLTVADGNITVNMQAANRTVAAPVAWTAPATTFPTFGCFVLQAAA